jgi:hypothetical protein
MTGLFPKITVATVAFLSIIAFLAAYSTATPGEPPFSAEYEKKWMSTVTTALSFLFALAFIVLGVAKIFNLRSLEFATKGEMYQLLVSLAIAGFIFSGGLEWVLNLMGGDKLYTEAKQFIDETWTRALSIYVKTIVIRGLANLLASVEVGGEAGIVVAGISLGAHPFSFLQPIAAALNRIGWFFIIALFSLKVHSTLLWFGHVVALKALLGPGVLLRAFRVTRIAGAFLIGLAVALYLVYPAIVVGIYKASYDEGKAALAEETAEKIREDLEGYKRDLFALSWDIPSLLAKIAAIPYALYTLLLVFFDALMAYVEELILLFMVLPLITIGVLVATVYAITEAFGGHSLVLRRFINLGRMV